MRYLLDASALLPLVTGFGKELLAKASKQWLATTDLGIYEACNSLWKLCTLLRTISADEAIETSVALKELTGHDIIHLVGIAGSELSDSLRLACEEKLTFYDASYLIAARNEKAVLVTDDVKLRESARSHVEVTTFAGLLSKLP